MLDGVLPLLFGSEIPSPQHRAHPIDLTLTALDANGYVATDFNRQANLSGAVGAGEVTIGNGSYPWEYPMATFYHDAPQRMKMFKLMEKVVRREKADGTYRPRDRRLARKAFGRDV